MGADILILSHGRLRGTDGNSLLRLYDQAQAIQRSSSSRVERARAGRALERMARELRRRGLVAGPAPEESNPQGSAAAATLPRP